MIRTDLTIFASAVALFVAVTPAAYAASATPTLADGFVSLAGGAATLSDSSNSADALRGVSIEGAASGEYNFTTTLGFQGDIVVRSQDRQQDGSSFGFNQRSYDAALHGFYRDDKYLFGAFGQIGSDQLTAIGNSFFGEVFNRYYGGAEAQAFFGNATLYGQAGAQQLSFGSLGTTNGWFANFEARYFLTPNFRIDGHLGGDKLSNGLQNFPDITNWRAGLGAEYRLDDKPFSIFAKYDFTQTQFGSSSSTTSDSRILVGVKFNFGTDTLEDRDRSGASLKPVETSSPFGGLPS